MAYDDRELGVIAAKGSAKGDNSVWMYQTGDAAATVEADGYFDSSQLSSNADTGDVLLAIMSDATKWYKLTVTAATEDVTLSTGLAIT